MSLGITVAKDPAGTDQSIGVYNLVGDNSYPANGYPLPAASFGRKHLAMVVPVQKGAANRLITWDDALGTLRIWTAINTEAGTGTDQSTISCTALVAGPRA